jgi:hypothetical protein
MRQFLEFYGNPKFEPSLHIRIGIIQYTQLNAVVTRLQGKT